MTVFEMVLVVLGGVLAIAALLVVYRMVVGPTIMDRAVATDLLMVIIVLALALYSARSQAAWAGPAMLAVTGTAFISTVTFARFVAREDTRSGGRLRATAETGSRPDAEPETDTGEHEAIHHAAHPEASPATEQDRGHRRRPRTVQEADDQFGERADGAPGGPRRVRRAQS